MAQDKMAVSAAPKVTPQTVRSKMAVPQQFQNAYERVVLAGRKLMYSDQMSDQIGQLMKGPGALGDKLGQGVLGLMAIITDQSKGTLPPQIIIPAGAELVAEAADLLHKAGVKVTDQDIAQGMTSFINGVMSKAKVDPNAVRAQAAQAAQSAKPPVKGA
jgi:hypothetical protein